MSAEQLLAALGAVPKGMTPKTILNGSEPGYYQTGHLENLFRAIDKFKFDQEQEQQKRMLDMQNKATLYKTLRESGYSPSAATKAVNEQSSRFQPDQADKPSESERKLKLESDKIRADIYKQNVTAKLAKEKEAREARKMELESKLLDKKSERESAKLDSDIQKNQAEIDLRKSQSDLLKTKKDTPGTQGALYQNAKAKRTENLYLKIEDNNVQRVGINDAIESSKKLLGGAYGKVTRGFLKNLNPNHPAMGDWQKIKMVLTDATLLNTAKTKGAISDKEMALFQDAAANDDFLSLPRVLPVLNRMVDRLNAEERALVQSYNKIYKEDPMQWEDVQSNMNQIDPDIQNKINQAKQAGYTDEEIQQYLRGQ